MQQSDAGRITKLLLYYSSSEDQNDFVGGMICYLINISFAASSHQYVGNR